MIKKGLRNNPPLVYDIGEKVLIRYPTAKKLCSKRCVLPVQSKIYISGQVFKYLKKMDFRQ